MSQEFNPNQIIYQGVTELDSNHKEYTFEYLFFTYKVRTFDGIIQYIKGQRDGELKTNDEVPTEEESALHDDRKEIYNGNHQPIQDWIDTL
jgi:hypothetical protein